MDSWNFYGHFSALRSDARYLDNKGHIVVAPGHSCSVRLAHPAFLARRTRVSVWVPALIV